jgi:acetyltransferase-like isoleucine patch superfamily enzyme
MRIGTMLQKIALHLVGKLSLWQHRLLSSNIAIGGGVIFKNRPSILVLNQSKINIGQNVLLNSSNLGYHVNMFGPVKLLADGVKAEIIIGNQTRIHGTCIHARKKISIGENCLIAANCQIIDSNAHSLSMENTSQRLHTVDEPREIVIGNNVWIGTGTVILPGTTIGDGSVIGANSVVRGTVPALSVYGGNPAVLLKQF